MLSTPRRGKRRVTHPKLGKEPLDCVKQKFMENKFLLNAGDACILLATKFVFWIFILKVDTIALKAFSISVFFPVNCKYFKYL